jgi:hypothetical protein
MAVWISKLNPKIIVPLLLTINFIMVVMLGQTNITAYLSLFHDSSHLSA